jgi:hypothetical protein
MVEQGSPASGQELLSRESREAFLVNLWERGLDTADCVAYHETSLEVIEHLISIGTIPGYTGLESTDPMLSQPGDIYFTPRENFPFDKIPEWAGLGNRGYPATIADLFVYSSIAFVHRACSFLGLDLNQSERLLNIRGEGLEFASDEDEETLTSLFSEQQLAEAEQHAKTRRGVVLGLTRSALDKYPLSPGDDVANGDIRLSLGQNGIPATAFSGLKALGEEESLFFQRLQIKHGPQLVLPV